MSLLNRLIGQNMTPEEEDLGKLPLHQCMGAWGEYLRGKQPWSDWAALISRFGLTPSEEAELSAWFAAAGAGAFTLEELEHILSLGETGHATEAEIKARLGL